jgi:hypothetical protein
VYLAECVLCGLQGVGSTANFKSRLANYKSDIKLKRRTCSITNHFVDVHEADNSSLKFMLIDQHHSELLKSENFWIGMLLINRKGLNGSHDFAQQQQYINLFIVYCIKVCPVVKLGTLTKAVACSRKFSFCI